MALGRNDDMADDAPIRYLPDQKAFLLAGDGFCYVLAVGPDGDVRHLHWGGPISPDDVGTLLTDDARDFGSNTWSSPRAHTEELVAHGGRRFDESALKVEFADGVRALDLASKTIASTATSWRSGSPTGTTRSPSCCTIASGPVGHWNAGVTS